MTAELEVGEGVVEKASLRVMMSRVLTVDLLFAGDLESTKVEGRDTRDCVSMWYMSDYLLPSCFFSPTRRRVEQTRFVVFDRLQFFFDRRLMPSILLFVHEFDWLQPVLPAVI